MDRAYAAEAGADSFLAKPFTEEDFRRRIESLLRETRAAIAS
jgi:two-component system chemotaxis response regulator CheY